MSQFFTRSIDVFAADHRQTKEILEREWLLTNGIGGYASGTISGMVSRRYHGLLVAALPPPLGRVVMLNHLAEFIRKPNGDRIQIGGHELPAENAHDVHAVREFKIEDGMPLWIYEAEGCRIERRVTFPHGQNTVHIRYRLLSAQEKITLELRPSVAFRPHETPVGSVSPTGYTITLAEHGYTISMAEGPSPLHLCLRPAGAHFTHQANLVEKIGYSIESERGQPCEGILWSPGTFAIELSQDHDVVLTASTDSWDRIMALRPEEAFDSERERRVRLIALCSAASHDPLVSELVMAADQFIIRPSWRVQDAAKVQATGDDLRTVIAGYHWFTDWGRDTMISLEGLTLVTGRTAEAGWILRTFAHHIRDGLIPNMFPEGEGTGLYHTADATLWFFHALDRYLELSGDKEMLGHLLPKLKGIIQAHLEGTRFHIGVDPVDGLLRQGEEGYQLTWMDAKVDGWVVTPRRGKAVEINALWYNALCLMEGWCRAQGDGTEAEQYAGHARRCSDSFNRRYWNPQRGCLLDVVDGEQGDDPALRPNQVLSISLHHPVLSEDRWKAVVDCVTRELLTPVGLRSLSRDHPDYKSRYFGDLRARDAAYHQGTVWAWLIGPFVDAWTKVYPNKPAEGRKFLSGLVEHLDHAGVGSVSEIFDAEPPFTPRGCIAQAWSVAELLRCWLKCSG